MWIQVEFHSKNSVYYGLLLEFIARLMDFGRWTICIFIKNLKITLHMCSVVCSSLSTLPASKTLFWVCKVLNIKYCVHYTVRFMLWLWFERTWQLPKVSFRMCSSAWQKCPISNWPFEMVLNPPPFSVISLCYRKRVIDNKISFHILQIKR